jgi:hypothetical protein
VLSFEGMNRSLGLLLPLTLTAVACGEASPVVVGHVEGKALSSALTAASAAYDDREYDDREYRRPGRTIRVKINGDARDVGLDDDDLFVLQDLPTGDITFEIENDQFAGRLTIKDVEPGETIDLSIAMDDDEIILRVTRRERRTPRSLPDVEGPIDIHGNDVIYHLDARTYRGDIRIHGNDVTLVGPRSEDCNPDAMAIVEGNLKVKGNDVRILDVLVLGKTDLKGHDIRVHQLCGR